MFCILGCISATADDKPFFKKALTAKTLKDFVEQNEIRSVEELLPLLPQSLRDNFTLALRSRSLQKDCVTPSRPRALLFSPDGAFVLAFTGGTKHPICRNVEILEFNSATTRFEMSEIAFDAKASAPAKFASKPESCVVCHGPAQDPRPVWEMYSNWPGFYGSHDDVIGALELGSDDDEAKEAERNFTAYKKQWMKDPLYKHLGWKTDPPTYPYTSSAKGSAVYRPNLRLTKFLALYQAKRVARRLIETKAYARYKFALQANLFQCSFIQDWQKSSDAFLKKIATSDHRGKIFTVFGVSETEVTIEFANDRKDSLSASYYDGLDFMPELVTSQLFRALMAENKKLEPYFVLNKNVDTDYSANGESGKTYVFPKEYAIIDTLGGSMNFDKQKEACPLLKTLHDDLYEKTASIGPENPFEESMAPTRSNPFKSCIACHTGQDAKGPVMPFDKPEKLKKNQLKKIRRRIHAKGANRMPPGAPLTKSERDAIDAFKPVK